MLDFAGPGTLEAPAGGDASGALAGSVSTSVDADPFALGVGGAFTLSAQGALVDQAAAAPVGIRGSISASLTVQRPATQTANGTVVVASGTLQGTRTGVGADTTPASGSAQISVEITRSGQTYEIAVTSDGAGEVLLWASLQGSPLTVQAAGELQAVAGTEPPATAANAATLLGDQTPLANPEAAAKLVASTDVFSPSNQLNVQAHAALQTLADVFDDPQYTGTVAARLFAATVGAGGSTGITATLDWVLFVRRRHKECQTAPAQTVAAKTYGVYVIEADNSAAYKLALSSVMQDDAVELKRIGVRAAGDVAFAGGTATLTSPVQSVVAAWSQTNPGALITAAVVATDETDEAASLLTQRVYSYQSAIASVSKPNTNEQLFNRGSLSSLPSSGVDGQIVLITQPQALRYHVYAAGNGDAAGALTALVENKEGIDKYFAIFALIDLGTVTFDDTTSTVEDNALKTLADANLQNGIERFVVVSQAGAPTEPISDQATAIMTELGASTPGPNVETVVAAAGIAWPADSPFVVLLAAPGQIT
jgi:ATP-dependent protease HslVU (ClpYQ) peptidase subunit